MFMYQLILALFSLCGFYCRFLESDNGIVENFESVDNRNIKPEPLKNFKGFDDKTNYQEIFENLEKLVENKITNYINENLNRNKVTNNTFQLNEYHRYDEIRKFLSMSATQFPSIASTFEVGTSYEGRDIIGIKIGKPKDFKRAIFIDAGIHAREWIAPAAALYIINTLLTQYEKNDTVRNLVDNLDWYIVPSVNPDGYEYTWNTDRLWRKTRSRQSCNTFRCCFGVDPNRNWDFHWGEAGTSEDPCSEMYQGPKPFSEPETKALSQMILSLRDQLDVYISLHAYGQLWLIPYGYKEHEYSSDFTELLELAVKAESEIEKVHGTEYKVENAAELYPASGSSDDWAKAVAGIKYSFTIELRPGNFNLNDANGEGFILPSDQIIPTGQELLAGLVTVGKNLLKTR